MNEIVTIQEVAPKRHQAIQVIDAVPVLDTARFEHMQRVASLIAQTSFVPETICNEGPKDKRVRLPFNVIVANVFVVVNQASRWGMDPFAVLASCSMVHGRLCYEGKLVAAVLDAKLGIKLDPVYNDRTGDALGIRITGRQPSGALREVEGTVGEWKTSGAGSPWNANPKRQLWYRGQREWARWWEPALMLGVYTPDELSDLQVNASANRATLIPSQQEQLAVIRTAESKPAAQITQGAKPEPAAAAKPRREMPKPPEDDEPKKAVAAEKNADAARKKPDQKSSTAEDNSIDWAATLTEYNDALDGCEAMEEVDGIWAQFRATFEAAPREVQGEAQQSEAGTRERIKRQEEA